MKRIGLMGGSLFAAASLLVAPALAAKHAVRHVVSCKQIKEAVASGKTADAVAKELKVTSARVKSCTAPTAKHPRKTTATKPS